ncbi:MAG TPA: DnaJ domain-containing protein [Gemmatimonadales bacterium]|nr:DnaJ domain-containing protein [Gemmatimonadales bacterium]
MDDAQVPDHYEVLQLSPRADTDTVNRVFRHLAKRLHPDNTESGDPEQFARVMEAFRVLSNPELRAAYDARYDREREARWRIFDQETALNDVEADRRLRAALLSILYTARRNDSEQPGLGPVDLERLLGCPEEHMKFHLWYLKENGLIQRLETGRWAITASGVDEVLERGGPAKVGLQLLEAGGDEPEAGAA